MKKLVILLFVLPLVFISCSDDDDGSLNGTTWVYEKIYEEKDEEHNDYKYSIIKTLKFQKTTVTGLEESYDYDGDTGKWVYDEKYRDEYTGTYTYEHPDLTIEFPGFEQEFRRDGKKLTFLDDYADEPEVYIKKK